MLGALAGDIIGSVYEHKNLRSTSFPLFSPASRVTDDSVLTVAIAAAITRNEPYLDWVLRLARVYPDAGYGGRFRKWMWEPDPKPYGSWGNGAAMRASPIGWGFLTEDEVLDQAWQSAAISHDHPEGIAGAQAVALAIHLARNGASRDALRRELARRFHYDLAFSFDEIRPRYRFDVSAKGSVPVAIVAFLESTSVEDAIRRAISVGGDSDTIASMAGAVAEAYYGGLDAPLVEEVYRRLPPDLAELTRRFVALCPIPVRAAR